MLLVKEYGEDKWEVLAKPGRKLKIGTVIEFSNKLKAEVLDILEEGERVI